MEFGDFGQGIEDNAALLGTMGAAVHLKNQRAQAHELQKQNALIKRQLEAENRRVHTEEQRLEIEKERLRLENDHRLKQEELNNIKINNLKAARKVLSNSKIALDRLQSDFSMLG
jgi:hypothetical protein